MAYPPQLSYSSPFYGLLCTYRWSTMVPFHLPHNINHTSASVKMAATSVIQRSCFRSSAKTAHHHHRLLIRVEHTQHSVPARLQCRSLEWWQQSRALVIDRCQLQWQEWQVPLEFKDSLFKGHSHRYTCASNKIWTTKQASCTVGSVRSENPQKDSVISWGFRPGEGKRAIRLIFQGLVLRELWDLSWRVGNCRYGLGLKVHGIILDRLTFLWAVLLLYD